MSDTAFIFYRSGNDNNEFTTLTLPMHDDQMLILGAMKILPFENKALLCQVLNLALPGIYPPFLLNNGVNMTDIMKKSGISSTEFFRKIKKQKINIPTRYSILDLNTNSSSYYLSNIEHYLLRTVKAKVYESYISVETNLDEDNVNLVGAMQEDVTGCDRTSQGTCNNGDSISYDVNRRDDGDNNDFSSDDGESSEDDVDSSGDDFETSGDDGDSSGDDENSSGDDGNSSEDDGDSIEDDVDSVIDYGDNSEDDDDPNNDDSDDDSDDDEDYADNLTPAERRILNKYLLPHAYNNHETRIQTGMDKQTFKRFIQVRKDRCKKRSSLSAASQLLLYVQRYRKAKPYRDLMVDFNISSQSCFSTIEQLMFAEVRNATHIPYLLHGNDLDRQVDITLDFLASESPPLIKNIARHFVDPTGRGRQVVFGFIDATYLYVSKSSNPMLQKMTFCKFKGQNVVKMTTITTATGKIFLNVIYNFHTYSYIIL